MHSAASTQKIYRKSDFAKVSELMPVNTQRVREMPKTDAKNEVQTSFLSRRRDSNESNGRHQSDSQPLRRQPAEKNLRPKVCEQFWRKRLRLKGVRQRTLLVISG